MCKFEFQILPAYWLMCNNIHVDGMSQILPAYWLMCNNIHVGSMSQKVSHGILTAENRVRYQRHSMWDLCWTK